MQNILNFNYKYIFTQKIDNIVLFLDNYIDYKNYIDFIFI